MPKKHNPGCAAGCGCGGTSGGGGTIGLPGCVCGATPAAGLAVAVTFGPGEDAHTYSNSIQSCTMSYYTATVSTATVSGATVYTYDGGTHPGYLPPEAYFGAGFYSDSSWIDDFGFLDYYVLRCFTSQYAIGLGQKSFDRWQSPGQIYTWSLGGSPVVNTCSPFNLAQGRTQQGVVFNGKIVITG